MNRTIEISISPKGETTVKTFGFTGDACRQASRALEQALGQSTNEQLTPEFYANSEQQQRLQEGQ